MNFNSIILGTLSTSVCFSLTSTDHFQINQIKNSFRQSSRLTPNFVYSQDIHHIFIGGRIISHFSPQDGQGNPISLDQLATKLGYEHFNWVNYVEIDPYGISDRTGKPLTTPYNDPPRGGYHYDPADTFPFYWDIVPCELCNQRHHLQDYRNLKQFSLIFEDAPADYRLQPGEAIKFLTSLVGVTKIDPQGGKAEWEILHTFRWQLTNPHPNYSQASLLDADVDLRQLSPIVLNTMVRDGALLPISEESSLN